jgi:hypothetical protein
MMSFMESSRDAAQSTVKKQIVWHGTIVMSDTASDRCESCYFYKEALWLDEAGDVVCREHYPDLIVVTAAMLREDPELFSALSLIQMKINASCSQQRYVDSDFQRND